MQTTDPEASVLSNSIQRSPSRRLPAPPNIPEGSAKPSLPAAQRKRAANACLACRARKVRCDVSQHGTPCMNCRMSGGNCVAVGRPTKYHTSKRREQGVYDNQRAQPRSGSIKALSRLEEGDGVHRSQTSQSGRIWPASVPSQVYKAPGTVSTNGYVSHPDDRTDEGSLAKGDDTNQWDKSWNPSISTPMQYEPADMRGISQRREWAQEQLQVADLSSLFGDTRKQAPIINPSSDTLNGSLLNEICGILGAEQQQSTRTRYLQHPLVKADEFSQNPPQDVEFLKSQGSFQIPIAPALDEFMRRYFIHVHPHLPIIDESAFWDAFDGMNRDYGPHFPISIFTFQAMLFACCSFVPLGVLQDVGFKSIREARTTMYRRAKLLFDFNGKRDPISTAQGALLLSYSPDTNNRKINTFWLGVAIQNARDANSHLYDSTPLMTENESNVRKRLYWCCILRDRILPLGVRRPIYITDAHFDFSKNTPLNAKDLEGEISHSKVYDPQTKRSLAGLVESLCELAVALTGIITVLYPVNEVPIASLSGAEISRPHVLIRQGRSDLTRWYEKVSVKFPTPAGLGDTHESVILYTDLMYLYYHSARMALCNLDLLTSTMVVKPLSTSPAQLHRNKDELMESSTGITDIMKELLQLRLIKYLPISAVAYIALPLVLNILDVKLSLTKSQCATRQRRLQIFMEAMKDLQAHYDGTDRVSDAIERLIRYLAVNSSPSGTDSSGPADRRDVYDRGRGISSPVSNPRQGVAEWGDVLVRLPNCYLRIVTTLDLALARGEFPDERDFPLWLQTSRLANNLPLYMMSQAEGEPAAQNPSRIDNSVRAFDKYYNDRGRMKTYTAIGTTTASQATPPSSYRGALHRDLQLEDVVEERLDIAVPQQNDSDDIQMDTSASRDVQLDAWMFDILQDFN